MDKRKQLRGRAATALSLLLIAGLVVAVSLPNLRSGNIDDLDSAHHLMDGFFFYDLLHGNLHGNIAQYVVAYHKQYPALGFLFWPPLVPFVLGIFDVLLGAHIVTARLSMLFFGLVFALGFYVILRREVSRLIALAAACAVVTVPGVFWSFNKVMLELPTLAFMMVAVLAVLHMVDKAAEPDSYLRAFWTAAACAAVIYAKQPAWFIYPALLVLVFRNPAMRRKRETWVGMGLIALFALPLIVYTAKFGHADLAQSVGSNTQLIMPSYHSLERWSFAAWSYYPAMAWKMLNPVVVLLGAGGLLLALKREFRRRYMFWIVWFVAFYLTFSFYDNRLQRHATFWWPAWVALAAGALQWGLDRIEQMAAMRKTDALSYASGPLVRYAPVVLAVPLLWQLPHGLRGDYSDFHGQRPIIQALYADHDDPGNILLYGPDKQTFIALIREYDTGRRDTAVRAERLLRDEDLPDVCRRYRVRQVVLEFAPGDNIENHPELLPLQSDPEFSPEFDRSYRRRAEQMDVRVFRYDGPIDNTIADVPLSKDLL